MIQATWTARDRKLLAIGACVIVPLLAARYALPAARDWIDVRTAAASERLRSAAAAGEEARLYAPMRDSLAARRRRRAAYDSMFVAARSASEAGAALANALGDLADNSAVRIVSIQVRPDTGSASAGTATLSRVSIRATGVADVSGLTALLRDVEGGNTLMAIRELTVTQPEPTLPDSKAETLRFDLVVEALAIIGRTAAGVR